MSVVVVLIGFSILVALGFLVGFLWAVRSGQYDDRHTPAVRMLFDDDDRTAQKTDRQTVTDAKEDSDHTHSSSTITR